MKLWSNFKILLNNQINFLEYSSRILTIALENLNKLFRSSRPEVFSKKRVLENFAKFTEKQLCQRLFLNKGLFIKNGPLVQVFSCGFREMFYTFFTEHLWTTASGYSRTFSHGNLCIILKR